jgi:hypothetical protein
MAQLVIIKLRHCVYGKVPISVHSGSSRLFIGMLLILETKSRVFGSVPRELVRGDLDLSMSVICISKLFCTFFFVSSIYQRYTNLIYICFSLITYEIFRWFSFKLYISYIDETLTSKFGSDQILDCLIYVCIDFWVIRVVQSQGGWIRFQIIWSRVVSDFMVVRVMSDLD